MILHVPQVRIATQVLKRSSHLPRLSTRSDKHVAISFDPYSFDRRIAVDERTNCLNKVCSRGLSPGESHRMRRRCHRPYVRSHSCRATPPGGRGARYRLPIYLTAGRCARLADGRGVGRLLSIQYGMPAPVSAQSEITRLAFAPVANPGHLRRCDVRVSPDVRWAPANRRGIHNARLWRVSPCGCQASHPVRRDLHCVLYVGEVSISHRV